MARVPWIADTPWRIVMPLGGMFVLAAILEQAGTLPAMIARPIRLAAGHAVMLAIAMGWAGAARFAPAVAGIAAGATLLAHATPAGAILYLSPALLIAHLTRRGHLARAGLGVACSWRAVAGGALVGALLGGHLIVSGSLTFGHRPTFVVAPALLGAIAYDVGLQVPATELFLRGAIFNRAQRLAPFGIATGVTTALAVIRYLVDPLLPPSAALVLGMVFYVSVLSVAACWLFWRYGSLAPALGASTLFFVGYRLLGSR
jgi:hypothetical protein